MDALTLSRASVHEADVRALLERHQALMQAGSPEESCHVMDPDSLMEAGAVLLACRDGDALLGVGAVKQIEPDHGEVKSMHTAAEARGRGVARVVLEGLLAEARAMGLARVSLETGSVQMFAAARALYEAHGFDYCTPFADYAPDPLSVFMTRAL